MLYNGCFHIWTVLPGFMEVGGLTSLAYKYMHAVPNTTLANPDTECGYPRDDALHIFRSG